jgi:hypothetical protein
VSLAATETSRSFSCPFHPLIKDEFSTMTYPSTG